MEVPVITGTYEEVRHNFENGDIVFIKSKNEKLFHRLTTFFTGSEYYHNGMAVWLSSDTGERRLFCVEGSDHTRRLIPMSVYNDHDIDVIKLPIPWKNISASALERVGHVEYSYPMAAWIGLREFFGFPSYDFDGEICSVMTTKLLLAGGYEIEEFISPGKLYETLINNNEHHKISIKRN